MEERDVALTMRKVIFCVLAFIALTATQGQRNEQVQPLMDSSDEQREYLQCYRCDLGFWDTCYTTTTNCSLDEHCFTGRGKAADVLDVKTLGCARPEECDVAATVELFPNNTVFIITKHCCNTPFCNSAHKPPLCTLLYVTVTFLITLHITGVSAG